MRSESPAVARGLVRIMDLRGIMRTHPPATAGGTDLIPIGHEVSLASLAAEEGVEPSSSRSKPEVLPVTPSRNERWLTRRGSNPHLTV